MSWGTPSAGRGYSACRGSPPALQLLCLARRLDPLFDFADCFRVFVELALVVRSDRPCGRRAHPRGLPSRTLRQPRWVVLEETVESESGVEFQRRRRGRRTPGDVRLNKASNNFYGPTRSDGSQARTRLRPSSDDRALGEHLVDAGTRTNAPPDARGAPESKLPVCELWMFPFNASSL